MFVYLVLLVQLKSTLINLTSPRIGRQIHLQTKRLGGGGGDSQCSCEYELSKKDTKIMGMAVFV